MTPALPTVAICGTVLLKRAVEAVVAMLPSFIAVALTIWWQPFRLPFKHGWQFAIHRLQVTMIARIRQALGLIMSKDSGGDPVQPVRD